MTVQNLPLYKKIEICARAAKVAMVGINLTL